MHDTADTHIYMQVKQKEAMQRQNNENTVQKGIIKNSFSCEKNTHKKKYTFNFPIVFEFRNYKHYITQNACKNPKINT